jgi:hypothetical protein
MISIPFNFANLSKTLFTNINITTNNPINRAKTAKPILEIPPCQNYLPNTAPGTQLEQLFSSEVSDNIVNVCFS